MEPTRGLLSVVTMADGREIHIHLDQRGISELHRLVQRAEKLLALGRTDHLHVFSSTWAPDGELSEWMPPHELEAGSVQVQHLKLYFHGHPKSADETNAV